MFDIVLSQTQILQKGTQEAWSRRVFRPQGTQNVTQIAHMKDRVHTSAHAEGAHTHTIPCSRAPAYTCTLMQHGPQELRARLSPNVHHATRARTRLNMPSVMAPHTCPCPSLTPVLQLASKWPSQHPPHLSIMGSRAPGVHALHAPSASSSPSPSRACA
jgi:hypothetical protein